MGVRYSSSESAALIEAMSSNIQIATQITEKLTSGSDHLIAEIEAFKVLHMRQGKIYLGILLSHVSKNYKKRSTIFRLN